MQQDTEAAPEAIAPEMFLMTVTQAQNVAALLTPEKLAEIGDIAVREYELDKASMADWRKRMDKGIELAALVKSDKTYPHAKAANVKFPLVTSAALQFNARAYPAIVPSDDIVKARVYGADAGGIKAARGERVSAHMSWQLANEVEEWEGDTDKLLLQLAIVGTLVRKVWHDPALGRICVRTVAPGAFVVNDKVKALSRAPRVTEEISYYPDEIAERQAVGDWLNVELSIDGDGDDSHAPRDFIEQHRRIDLDGDGYGEPYIVVVHKATRTVVRLVADFEPGDVMMGEGAEGPRIVSIKRNSYYIAYEFLPSITGGFWGTGLGLLLGDISDTINSIINMQLDAGHYASLGGGFIGSEFRLKGGAQQFRPGEWRQVQATGQDVRASIVPLTFPGPDATLFQLLGLLIEAGREIASVKDIITGDSGTKNMTATTTLALIEQGMMVFTAAYKRIFRALKAEFRLIAKINAGTVTPEAYNAFHDAMDANGQPMLLDPRADYNAADMDIAPVADPRAVTKMQEAAKAQIVMELAQMGMADPAAAGARVLESMSIGEVEELLPKPDPMAQKMGEMALMAADADLALKLAQVEKAIAEIEETRTKSVKNLADAQATEAQTMLAGPMAALERVRDEIRVALARGTGRMAGAPGGRGGQGGPGGPSGAPAGIPDGFGGISGGAGGPGAGGGSPFGLAGAEQGGGVPVGPF